MLVESTYHSSQDRSCGEIHVSLTFLLDNGVNNDGAQVRGGVSSFRELKLTAASTVTLHAAVKDLGR